MVDQSFKQRKFMFHINFRNKEEKLPNSVFKNRISLMPGKNGKGKQRNLWVHFAYELHMKKKILNGMLYNTTHQYIINIIKG